MFLSVLGFLVILLPLVLIHEYGHYIFARIFGVKAEIFSIGFGPKLWSKQIGETELRISAIPLGGYVKLLGEDRDSHMSEAELKRALHRQAAWKRFFIFFGGPLFNFLMAIALFMAILVIGEQHVASVVGRVVHHSTAEKAGFSSGDLILSVNGIPVRKFEEVAQIVSEHPGRPIDFVVKHPGSTAPSDVKIVPQAQEGYSVYGEQTHVGDVDGLLPTGRVPRVGVSDPNSAAAKAGLSTGDVILEVNGSPIKSWEEFEIQYAGFAPVAAIQMKVKKGSGAVSEIGLVKPARSKKFPSLDWGLHSSELFVEKTLPGSPAEKAGVQTGDRLVAVEGREVHSFFELKDAVQQSGEKTGKVSLKWERDGKINSVTITPTLTDGRDPVLNKTRQFTVGVMPMLLMAEPAMVIERIWNPFTLFFKATERMVTFSWRNLVSVTKMFTGDVSVGTLGGPILIGKLAGESLSRGLIAFLTTMAILSIGLGVLNILPVPVLDGGHLLLLGIEAIRGRPLTIRQMEIIQGVGLIFILALMGLVIRNDLARLPYF